MFKHRCGALERRLCSTTEYQSEEASQKDENPFKNKDVVKVEAFKVAQAASGFKEESKNNPFMSQKMSAVNPFAQ